MHIDINRFLESIIKYADELDIGQFLINVHTDLIDRIPGYDISPKTNRESLIEHLYDNNPHKKLLFFHLRMLARCFYSNEVWDEEKILKYEDSLKCDMDSDMEVSPDKLGIFCIYKGRENIITFEELTKCTKMGKGDFKEIFKLLVNCYKNNRFYYWIHNDYITKIINVGSNEEPIFKRVKYQLLPGSMIKRNHTMFFQDNNTGIKYDLGEIFMCRPGELQFILQRGVKKCKNLHNHIINSINGIPKCSWCNPCNSDIEVEPCGNCKKLIKKLEYFKNIDENNEIFKISNIKKELDTINETNCTNLSEIRTKRSKLLKQKVKDIIKEVKYGYTYNNNDIKVKHKKIKELIDICFTNIVKI